MLPLGRAPFLMDEVSQSREHRRIDRERERCEAGGRPMGECFNEWAEKLVGHGSQR